MTYAVVQDVPASWEQYEPFGAALRERLPEGLIFHLAGPTDEGYRTIEVWETREAWERFRGPAGRSGRRQPEWAVPALRELRALSAIAGASLPAAGVAAPHEPEARDGFAEPASTTTT